MSIAPSMAQSENRQTALAPLSEEIEVAGILTALGETAPIGPVAIVNVRIVDVENKTVSPGQAVVANRNARGRINWIGAVDGLPNIDDLTVIDGEGRYLAPGLADMHVHVGSASGWLLNLANGVTTIREMDGTPWTLAARQSINAGRMLAPSFYVAGTIINAYPMSGFAVVPTSPSDTRRIVREQAACGYDFIKVHNVLPLDMFRAVADQAHALGMDVVGHVPHGIDLHDALMEMRTSEHLKGFLDDRTLLPNETDFKKALKGIEVWIAPTLYTRYDKIRGAEAQAALDGVSARYVPARRREEWRQLIADGLDETGELLAKRHDDTRVSLMKRLIPLRPHWLAGTDADGYAFNVMGFALLEELRMMREAGLQPADTLRAATIEPARAMREDAEFGRIEVGMRADFALLDENPLENTSTYQTNAGVMARGHWLSRQALDVALGALANIYADGKRQQKINAAALVNEAEAAYAAGFIFAPYYLRTASDALLSIGAKEESARLIQMVIAPTSPPCAQETPQ